MTSLDITTYARETYHKNYYTLISNIHVDNYNYETRKEHGFLIIRIGDSDKTVLGTLDYKFSYDIQMQDLGVENLQIFYYDILDLDWNMSFKEVEFKINFPKNLENNISDNIKFYVGEHQSTDNDDLLYYWEDSKTLIGYIDSTISAKIGITAKMDLPDEYLILPTYKEYVWIGITISIITLVFILYKFIKYGRIDK